MKWFKLDEFKCHCCGKIASVENTISLVENVLDPAREELGHSVTISSGTRCESHNAECPGASRTSQHKCSEAADLNAGSPAENLRLARIIIKNGKWDQLILYVNSETSMTPKFVHVSWKRSGVNRKQVLKKTPRSYVKVEPSSI